MPEINAQGKLILTSKEQLFKRVIFEDIVESLPPKGTYKVTNLYVDSTGRLVVEYEDKR